MYCALIGYIYYEAPKNEQNFSTLVEMINAMEVREDDEDRSKTRLTCCLTLWNRKTRTTSPSGSIKNISWRLEMYALSDFLIMVFVMVSEAVT